MSMRKTTIAPGQLLRSVHMEESYLGKAGYPLYRPCTEAKLIPGSVSCPRGNELSRNHVNAVDYRVKKMPQVIGLGASGDFHMRSTIK